MMHGVGSGLGCACCKELYQDGIVNFQKTDLEIYEVSRAAGILVDTFDYVDKMVRVGVKPSILCKRAVEYASKAGAKMDYGQISFCRNGYVHPIVRSDEPLERGEVFTLDMWLSMNGWYADLARPYSLEVDSTEQSRLYSAALGCQKEILNVIKPGKSYLTLVESAQKVAREYGCYIIEEACGHGIGRRLHEDPVVSFSYAGKNLFSQIPKGVVLTVEVALSLEPCKLIQDIFGGFVSNTGATVLYAEAMVAINPSGNVIVLGS